MVDLLQAFATGDDSQRLEPIRLGVDPTHLLLFTRDGEEVPLHYEPDPVARGYVLCPGADCPLCYIGGLPAKTFLLPALDLESRRVGVLRIPPNRGAGSLAGEILPHLGDASLTGIEDKLFLVSRPDRRFVVVVRQLAASADRCVGLVRAFTEQMAAGQSLASSIPHYSPDQLAEIPRVSRLLAAHGGWISPAADTERSGDVDS